MQPSNNRVQMSSNNIVQMPPNNKVQMSSNFKFEPGALARPQFLMKIFQIVLGVICFGITVYYSTVYVGGHVVVSTLSQVLYMILVSHAFTFLTFWLLISSLFQADVMPKTFFEVTFGFLGFIMYLTASFTVFSLHQTLKQMKNAGAVEAYNGMIAAAVIALLNGGLYLGSFIMAFREIKAIK